MITPAPGYGTESEEGQDPRGAYLLHDAEGWRRRYRTWGLWNAALVHTVVSVAFLVFYFLYVWQGLQYFDEGATFRERAVDFGPNAIRFLALVTLALLPYYLILTTGPAPAILTGGVQLRKGKFVPFTSVCATHVFTKGLLLKTRELLLEPVLRDDWHGGNPFRVWVVPMMIVGEDGKDLIDNKVREVIRPLKPDPEPPPLKIYGTEDVRDPAPR